MGYEAHLVLWPRDPGIPKSCLRSQTVSGRYIHTYDGKEKQTLWAVNDNEATHFPQCPWGPWGHPCPSQPWWYWQRTSGEPEPLPWPPSSNEESLLPSSNRCLVKNMDSTMAWQEWDSAPSLWWCILRKGLLSTNFIKDPESHNTIPKQIRVFIFLQVGSSELTLALPYHQGFMELTVQWGDRF